MRDVAAQPAVGTDGVLPDKLRRMVFVQHRPA
jgi:hypothetical protein